MKLPVIGDPERQPVKGLLPAVEELGGAFPFVVCPGVLSLGVLVSGVCAGWLVLGIDSWGFPVGLLCV
jgi:hypothetical protein